jgi:hypothetical protein
MNKYPLPSLNPFERFQATDGILINAHRWKRSHDYHRQRQNFYYQTLHQPGIIAGLGVKIITSGAKNTEKSERPLVEIQAGMAIDLYGNPIIIPQPQQVYLDKEPPVDKPLIIYLVVSYKDPDELENTQGQEMVKEQFSIYIKTNAPDLNEVELCRILIPPSESVYLIKTKDVFLPGAHCLDFRFRQQVSIRSHQLVRIAQVKHQGGDYNRNFNNLSYLLKATFALYPHLEGLTPVGLFPWQDEEIYDYDLLYLTGSQFKFNDQEIDVWKNYLANGGVVLIDLKENDDQLIEYIQNLAKQEFSLELKSLSARHFMRQQPFLFAALPQGLSGQPIQVLLAGGIILVRGNLGEAWGVDQNLSLKRETIRTAQEFGINILSYAWQRHMMTQLQV